MSEKLNVWIEQDLCHPCSLCSEIAPDVFKMASDGLAYTAALPDTEGVNMLGLYTVISEQHDLAIEAAEECPGECIMIEVEA